MVALQRSLEACRVNPHLTKSNYHRLHISSRFHALLDSAAGIPTWMRRRCLTYYSLQWSGCGCGDRQEGSVSSCSPRHPPPPHPHSTTPCRSCANLPHHPASHSSYRPLWCGRTSSALPTMQSTFSFSFWSLAQRERAALWSSGWPVMHYTFYIRKTSIEWKWIAAERNKGRGSVGGFILTGSIMYPERKTSENWFYIMPQIWASI